MIINHKDNELEVKKCLFLCHSLIDKDSFINEDDNAGWWKSKRNLKIGGSFGYEIEYGVFKQFDSDDFYKNLFIGREIVLGHSFYKRIIVIPFSVPSDKPYWRDDVTRAIVSQLSKPISVIKKILCDYFCVDTFTSMFDNGSIRGYTHYSNPIQDFNILMVDLEAMLGLFNDVGECSKCENCRNCGYNITFPKSYNVQIYAGLRLGVSDSVCFRDSSGRVIKQFIGEEAPDFIECPSWCYRKQ